MYYSHKFFIRNVLGNADETIYVIMHVHVYNNARCTFCKSRRARTVKWKWRESANTINENSRITSYVLHFPDATWDRFPRPRVRGTCRCVVRHVLRYVVGTTRLLRSLFVATTISYTATI